MLQDQGGVVINITATLQVRGQAFQTHAGAAKAAIGEAVRIKSRIQPNFINGDLVDSVYMPLV